MPSGVGVLIYTHLVSLTDRQKAVMFTLTCSHAATDNDIRFALAHLLLFPSQSQCSVGAVETLITAFLAQYLIL